MTKKYAIFAVAFCMGKKKKLPSDEVLALALEREVLKPEVKMSHCENRKEIIKMPDSNN